jgi:hypothetical protein
VTTSQRKNQKRLKALLELQRTNPRRFEAERTRLLRAWAREIRLRVCRRDVRPAAELISIGARFGLAAELVAEFARAVHEQLGGPTFVSRSVTLPRGAHPDAVAAWCEAFVSRAPERTDECPTK